MYCTLEINKYVSKNGEIESQICIENVDLWLLINASNIDFNSWFATFADLHVRTRATFADLQLYTRLWLIHIAQSSDYHCFWFALFACITNLPFWKFPYNLQVKRYSELNIVLLNVAPIPVRPKVTWHTGDLYLANKELNWTVVIVSFSSTLLQVILSTHHFWLGSLSRVWIKMILFEIIVNYRARSTMISEKDGKTDVWYLLRVSFGGAFQKVTGVDFV